VNPGERFGKKYLYKWWKRASANLGISDVDLYGGSRHSSAQALAEFFSPEEIRQSTMHATNGAFERYFRTSPSNVRKVYEKTRSRESGKGVLEFTKHDVQNRSGENS
jgi:hypothetical protein